MHDLVYANKCPSLIFSRLGLRGSTSISVRLLSHEDDECGFTGGRVSSLMCISGPKSYS